MYKKRNIKENIGERQRYRRLAEAVEKSLDEIEAYNKIVNYRQIPVDTNPSINSPECKAVEGPSVREDLLSDRSSTYSSDLENLSHCNERDNSNECESIDENENNFSQTNNTLSSCVKKGNTDLSLQLRTWISNHNISQSAATDLLQILSPLHSGQLSSNFRKLMQTPKITKITNLENSGEYCLLGLTNALKRFLSSNIAYDSNHIQISFNIDGLPLYRSWKKQLWPISGLVKGFKASTFAIGIFCGISKPSPIELFLKDFINELCILMKEGFIFNSKFYTIEIYDFICDAPARANFKQTKSHGGYSACDKCMIVGDYVCNKVIYPETSLKRTDESFVNQTDEDHHDGQSPLLKLGIGLVSKFLIDYMHCICSGVVKKLLCTWNGGKLLKVRLRSRLIELLSQNLLSVKFCIPLEINRKPRTITELQRWKATEFRSFLSYLGPIVLKNIVSLPVYENFLLLHSAVRILTSDKHISKFGCDFAQNLLNCFVEHSKTLYGLEFLVYNVHLLSHIGSDAEVYGPLDAFSAFPFENYLGKMKRLVISRNKPLQQIHRRLVGRNLIFGQKCPTKYATTKLEMEHNLGPLMDHIHLCKQFKKLIFRGVTYTIAGHSNKDCYFFIKGGTVVRIDNILRKQNGDIMVITRRFETSDSFYMYPLDSKQFNIYVVAHLSKRKESMNVSQIIGKCVLLPILDKNNYWVSFPLLHSL